MIEIWGLGSPNVHKVIIALEELGLPYLFHFVDCPLGENYTEGFTALNPNRKAPVMVDHDGPGGAPFTIWESGAILIYLAEKTGKLMSADPVARYTTLQWVMFQMAGIGPMFGQLAHFRVYAPDEAHAYSRARYATEVRRLYDVVDARLAEHEYIAGPEYSIADIAAWPWMHNTERRCVDVAELPHVGRWIEALAVRPAIAKSMEWLAAVQSGGDPTERMRQNPDEFDRYLGRGRFSRASPLAMQV
jgi:GST-like protein